MPSHLISLNIPSTQTPWEEESFVLPSCFSYPFFPSLLPFPPFANAFIEAFVLLELALVLENNLYSVVAKTNTFLPTNKKLTYQHETKKTQKE
jgi:hypothetical protein